MRLVFALLNCFVFVLACAPCAQVPAQEKSVYARVVITRAGVTKTKSAANVIRDASNVAVWLTPTDGTAEHSPRPVSAEKPPQLVQRHKTFEPHILIVPVGTLIEFPNKDPFFHNIFSLYDGRRFDLGLYEAGTTRSVLFDRPGVSFLFCNIHAEMSAIVIAVETPYSALSDRSGNVTIPKIPDGRYQLHVWFERSSPEQLKGLTRVVTIAESSRNLGQIDIQENPNFTPDHKNKYGLDYVPPPNPEYDRP
jgi:plastocyanin